MGFAIPGVVVPLSLVESGRIQDPVQSVVRIDYVNAPLLVVKHF
jgi:hypothetical protein